MKKIIDCYDKLEKNVLIASLLASTLVLFLQVIMRKVFNNSLSWSEELARFVFMWQIWLGVSIAQRQGSHIQIDLIFKFVRDKKAKAVRVLVALLNIAFCAFMVYVGWEVVSTQISMGKVSPAMRIPMWVVYFSLPFSFFVTMLRYIQALFEEIGHNGEGRPAPEGE